MHQSVPPAPSPPPPGLLRGICPPCQSRGWGICKFCTARGPGICQPPGHSRAFDTYTVSYQNITTYLCWLVLSECRPLEYWNQLLNMHARALYATYASISKHGNGKHYIFVLTVKTCRIFRTREQRFLWLICSRREHLRQDRSLFRLQLCRCVFEADFLSFYSTWKLRPYKVDVTLFQFVNRKIVCEFWNDSNIP